MSMDKPEVSTKQEFLDTSKFFTGTSISQAYAKHRHSYCDELFKTITDYCRETLGDLRLSVDVGCGPGNSTLGFTKYFNKVIGVDVSETQIAAAPKDIANCEFRVGHSHKLPFIETGSVDLFCSGESFHYMPQKETFAEADRVLRPGGTIALFGYDHPRTGYHEVDSLISQIFHGKKPCWNKESTIIFERFCSVKLPYPCGIRRDDIKVFQKSTIEGFMNQLSSLSVVKALLKDEPNFIDEVNERLTTGVRETTGDKSENPEFDIHYSLFLLMAHKPIKPSTRCVQQLLETKPAFSDYTQSFKNQDLSANYVKYRHSYCDELYEAVTNYCRETLGDLKLAVDVGCGPGNSTLGFTKYFKKVIGVDVSETQIAAAPKDIANCEFRLGYSEKLPFIDTGSVDLYSSGESFHYMPQNETYAEADRVLRPGGVIALFGYAHPQTGNSGVDMILEEVINQLVKYANKGTAMILDRFSTVKMPYSERTRRDDIKVWIRADVEDVINFLSSMSVTSAMLKDEPQFLNKARQRLIPAIREMTGDQSENVQFDMYYSIFLIMARKPC